MSRNSYLKIIQISNDYPLITLISIQSLLLKDHGNYIQADM